MSQSLYFVHSWVVQVLLSNSSNSIYYQSFVCTQLNGYKYCYETVTIRHHSFQYTQFNDLTVLFQTIQFTISHLFAQSLNVKQYYWPIDRSLSRATTPSQSGHGSDDNEEVLCIPQSSSINGVLTSDYLVLYRGHLLGGGQCRFK